MTVTTANKLIRSTTLAVQRSLFRELTKPTTSTRKLSTTISSNNVLHSESIGNDTSPSSILFLHGLLGNGRNLKTFAKQVCQIQETKGHLMDLRGHGQSRITETHGPNSHSFQACVGDIAHTSTSEFDSHPDTIVGHSWGGRMALQYAANADHKDQVKRVWLLDTVPGQAHSSVEQVIDAVDQLSKDKQAPPKDRKELVHILTTKYGLDMAIAQWLASSFRNGDFGFDLNVVQDILPEFGTQDFYGMLETLLENGVRVDLVRGGKNTAWSIETLSTLEALAKENPQEFGLHVLPKAGHWVHVDDLKGLVNLFELH